MARGIRAGRQSPWQGWCRGRAKLAHCFWVHLFGHNNQPAIGSVADFVGGWFDVLVWAYSPEYNTDRIERRFRFYYDENEAPMFFRPDLIE